LTATPKDGIMQTLRHIALGAFLLLAAGGAQADEVKAGDLVLRDLWSRATPKGAATGAAYMTIENRGAAADRLLAGTTPAAAKFEVHEMRTTDGIMRMRPVQGGLSIAPGATVTLEPNGYHIMLVGLKAPLKAGDKVPATLQFEKAGEVEVAFDVRPLGASGPAAAMPAHGGH
jgi:copper(I)-binding protein